MKSIKQLLRQPIKTLFGTALVALAVAVLCVCLGQTLAAVEAEDKLDQTFQTAVFPSAEYSLESDQWALAFAREHPEIVKAVSEPGLISAYIPAMTPDNYTAHYHNSEYIERIVEPYNWAVLEITLTEMSEPAPISSVKIVDEINDAQDLEQSLLYLYSELGDVSARITGTVERVIGLAEGSPDCVGMTARVSMWLPSMEAYEALELEVGQRYLVFCTDFQNLDYDLRARLSRELGAEELLQWHPTDPIYLFNHKELLEYNPSHYNGVKRVGRVKIGSHVTFLYESDPDSFQSVFLYAKDASANPKWDFIQNEDGEWEQVVDNEYTITNENGESVPATREEYHAVYAVPTIARLDGTAEAFLESEEGQLWREALHNINVTNHAFPVVGVDELGHIADFIRGMADIAEGRNLTAEELAAGAKVCLISQTVAEANGLRVGDTIDLSFYEYDGNYPYHGTTHKVLTTSEDRTIGAGVEANPTAYDYFENTTPLQSAQTYTIVGLYKQDRDWTASDENLYAFTPNTVFAPKNSISGDMLYGSRDFFRTFVLHNGMMDEFADAAVEAGFYEEFNYFDNGFSQVEDGLRSYQEIAERAMIVGLIVYGVVLLLFLILYPAQHGKTLATMDSLGAGRFKKIRHLIASSLGVLIPGTAIGIAAGVVLWRHVVDALLAMAESNLSVELDTGNLVLIGGIQFALAAVLVMLLAIPMTKRRSLSKRK